MDATTKKIVQMLSDDRIERRCAAAMVLGELRCKEPAVLEALGQCLDDENHLLLIYSLEAMAGSKSPKVARYVMPLLDHSNEEVTAQAAALLANQGSRAQATLAKELHGAPMGRRRAIVNILARSHDKATFERLLELLPDAEIGEYILISLRNELEHMGLKETETLRTLVSARLKDKEWLTDNTGTARTLRMIGYLRDPKLVRTLLPFAKEKKPVPVRLAALAALRRPLAASRSTDDAVMTILGYADDPDPTLARAAIDTLRSVKIPEKASGALMKLTEGRHAEARKFALEALGRSGDQKVIKRMLSHLNGDDPTAREAAERSLARMEGATSALLKELKSSEDTDLVRVLCRLLRRHAERLKPAAHKTITELTITALEQDLATADPLLDLLGAVEPESFANVLLARAVTHKKAKRHSQAFTLLSRLDSAGLLDDEGRYATVVTGLCSLNSKKELGRASRTTDPILRQVVALIENGYPVASKLKKERSLTAEDLFFVGFNFSESKDEDEKEFGGMLLSRLATHSPRSKLGRSAKNKLRLVGLE